MDQIEERKKIAKTWFDKAIDDENIDNKIEYLKQAIRLFPDYKDAWYELALIYDKKKNYGKASQCYEAVVSLMSPDPKIWAEIGLQVENSEEFDKIVSVWKKIVNFSPDNVDVWYNLGVAYTVLKKHNKAIECWNKVREISPDNKDIEYNLAYSHIEKAVEHIKKVLDLDKSDEKAKQIYSTLNGDHMGRNALKIRDLDNDDYVRKGIYYMLFG